MSIAAGSLIVTTQHGRLRGQVVAGVATFKGHSLRGAAIRTESVPATTTS